MAYSLWPYDASLRRFKEELVYVRNFVQRHWHEPWFLQKVVPGKVGKVLSEISEKVKEGEKKGNTYIGYMSQIEELRAALRDLDSFEYQQQHGTLDTHAAGAAFGRVFMATSTFVSYAPFPFNAYAKPLEEFGKAFAGIADLMSGNSKYYHSGYSRGQVRAIMNPSSTGNI